MKFKIPFLYSWKKLGKIKDLKKFWNIVLVREQDLSSYITNCLKNI